MSPYTGWHLGASPTELSHGGGPYAAHVELAGPPVLCIRGYHASAKALDCLSLGTGVYLSRRTLTGRVVVGGNKAAGSVCDRGPVVDATALLRRFAADCAARALRRERAAGRETDPRSWDAVRVARRHATGRATDAELTAAGAAAVAAIRARTGAGWAARYAARDATGAAAWAVADAGHADRAAAWAAAWAAAGNGEAARDAERTWQERSLTQRFSLALREVRA